MISFTKLTIVTAFANTPSVTKIYLKALSELTQLAKINFVFGIDFDPSGQTEALLVDFSKKRNLKIKVIKNEMPLGFAKTVNKLITEVTTPYTLLMDSDVNVTETCVGGMLTEIEIPDVASVQPLLVYPQTNRVQSYGHVFGYMFNKHALNGQPLNKVFPLPSRDAQGITTACQIFKTDLYRVIGGLDEAYYNAYEGLELSLKLRALGYRTTVLGHVYAYHFQGKSRANLKLNESIANAKFWSRWHSTISPDFHQLYSLEDLQKIQNIVIVNCSSFEDWYQIIPDLEQRTDITVKVRARGQNLELWESLSLNLLNYAGTIIFLCDHINQVKENTYWFSRRENKGSVALDLHGNMITFS